METKEYWKEGIDSKEYLIRFLFQLKKFILIGVAGAVIGSGLYLIIMLMATRVAVYQSEMEYYIDFAGNQLEGGHYYNDFTWNTAIASDLILGRAMGQLEGYDREAVKQMITADVLSDVRYLTITVRGKDAQEVDEVSVAIGETLEYFGTQEKAVRDTFDRIFKIEDSGVIKVSKSLFTWRAACLGFVIGFLTAWFGFSIQFAVADAFYTRANVERYLRIPSLGIRYRKGKGAALVKVQEEETEQGIVLLIPFGVSCRRGVEDRLRDLQRCEKKIAGAILVEADTRWMKLYYGALGGEVCD